MSTGPTGGSGGTTGPGHVFAALMSHMRARRARSAAAAVEAGGRGRFATPLTAEQREDRYRRQTGAAELTPRQRRRSEHKANRAAVRAA